MNTEKFKKNAPIIALAIGVVLVGVIVYAFNSGNSEQFQGNLSGIKNRENTEYKEKNDRENTEHKEKNDREKTGFEAKNDRVNTGLEATMNRNNMKIMEKNNQEMKQMPTNTFERTNQEYKYDEQKATLQATPKVYDNSQTLKPAQKLNTYYRARTQ